MTGRLALETTRPDEVVPDWTTANQRHLVAELDRVRQAIEDFLERGRASRDGAPDASPGRSDPRGAAPLHAPDGDPGAGRAHEPRPPAFDPPPMLDQVGRVFGLSDFERDILTLCAGIELDSSIPRLCAEAHGDTRRAHVTFGLALAALSRPHWTAVGPNGPLRYWRFVELEGESPTSSPLRIDERLLHHLTGVPHLDPRVAELIEPVGGLDRGPVESHEAVAHRLASFWSTRTPGEAWPVHLYGGDAEERRAIATSAAGSLGVGVYRMDAGEIPVHPGERKALARLWERESLLGGGALLIEVPPARRGEPLPGLAPFLREVRTPAVLAAASPVASAPPGSVRLRVPAPSWIELRTLWREALGGDALSEEVARAVDDAAVQFRLGGDALRAAAAHVQRDPRAPGRRAEVLWNACRVQARPSIDDLAQRIEPAASWKDLVLPEPQMQALGDIAVHFRQRATVHERWGWRERSSRGLGICALFAGASGTGKTMAAEVLAGDLRLDLYRVDLSAVVSKYIGETEKNLRRIFDAADRGGVILLFDEADALFGKRSEVKDSHDRYANIEIGYLLQRMEAYRGLAILTTNMRSALDRGFLRRLRFVVEFPFPDAAARAEIWKRIFPPPTPTEGLDPSRLARLNVAGGHIRNIALHASFLAAERGDPVRMEHVRRAARGEYSRLERPLSSGELRGVESTGQRGGP